MKFKRFAWCAVLLAVWLIPCVHGGADKKNVAKAGKAATAFVEVKMPRGIAYGSAFCVHSSGLFITNLHVVDKAQSIKLVMSPGEKAKKVLTATVVRSDPEADLALLRVDGKGLPVLPLGSDEELTELAEVIACGFPFGQSLSIDRQEYPAISVNAGKVTALRKKNQKLHLIQIDVALNPGNSGGPILDQEGKVVGVVVAGVRGSGVNFAIPVSKLHSFVASPEISFKPPTLTRTNMNKPIAFEARAASLVPSEKPLDVDLVLRRGGRNSTTRLKEQDGVFRAEVTLVANDDGKRLPLDCTVEYDDGNVAGSVEDQTFKSGDESVKLSEVRSIALKKYATVLLVNGKTLQGKITGLDSLTLQLGGKKIAFDLSSAAEVKFAAPSVLISCTIIVSRAGKEIGRLERFMTDEAQWNKQFLCDMMEFDTKVGYGQLGKAGKLGYGDSGPSTPVLFNGGSAPKALSLHAVSNGSATVKYRLDKKSSVFKSTIGLHESEEVTKTPLTFEVLGDGKSLWKSKVIKGPRQTDACLLDVSQVDVLELRVHCPGDFHAARAIWFDPHLLSNATGR